MLQIHHSLPSISYPNQREQHFIKIPSFSRINQGNYIIHQQKNQIAIIHQLIILKMNYIMMRVSHSRISLIPQLRTVLITKSMVVHVSFSIQKVMRLFLSQIQQIKRFYIRLKYQLVLVKLSIMKRVMSYIINIKIQ